MEQNDRVEQHWALCALKQGGVYRLVWLQESMDAVILATKRTFDTRAKARGYAGRRYGLPFRAVPALRLGAGQRAAVRAALEAQRAARATDWGWRRGDPNLSPLNLMEQRKLAEQRTRIDVLGERVSPEDAADVGEVSWILDSGV